MGVNLLITLVAAASLQDARPDLSQTFGPQLARYVELQRFPGLAIGVVTDGEVIYAQGFGEATRGAGTPITTQSIFHMASLSKPFTATAIMQLVEAGKLELDAPVVKYLPYFRLAEEESLTITLRQILTHTSGFPDVEDYEWDKPQHDEGAAERYVRGNVTESLVFEPGAGQQYSNMAFDTLGDVIGKASGSSFESYMSTHVLGPLGMTSSSFIHAETPEEHRTQGHSIWFTETIEPSPCPVYPYNRRHAPSSTLNSSVDDMCRWMLANLARGELDGERILAEESYAEMWSRDDETPGVGLSWFLEDLAGRPSVMHSGGDTGFTSLLILLPEDGLGVVLMSNTDGARLGRVAAAALQAALGEQFTLPLPEVSMQVAQALEQGGVGAAIERYLALREREPDAWDFGFDQLDLVCEVLIWKERYGDAVELASLNADLFDRNATAHARLGQALAGSGDTDGARELFSVALEFEPSHGEARAGLAALDG